ncbi:MAG: polyprenyl diphosphate synthase [Gammaproteobacteria bacterium]|nr:polyprenyl diphosphate synthase [Gammaproteobacteria bacterium]MDH3856777.1 polyprenyl diphosphate synthase [Gammaproteobacteria bacterium]
MTSQSQASIPGHVCIIMDGNGRWAKKRMMPRSFGHRQGVETTRRVVEYFAGAGIKHLTLFAFSSENWNRPDEEVHGLMDLFMQSLQKYSSELHEKGIRIRFIGNRARFSSDLQQRIDETETMTCENDVMTLNIAANYGGQWDIVNAARILAERVSAGELLPSQIDEQLFRQELSLGDSPDPDLFIRTGGEQRVSNFLLWQLAYTEFYFCDRLWPEFSDDDMRLALSEYARRQRRYGKTGEQIEAAH